MKVDTFVSIVAPLKNMESTAVEFVKQACSILDTYFTNYEVVLIDDGSKDNTVGEVSKLLPSLPCIRLICLSRAYGVEVAITAGLETAIGDFIIVMNPETDSPSLVPELVEKCRSGSDMLVGVAINPSPRPWFSRLLRKFFHWYMKKFIGIDIIPNATRMFALSRQAVNAITRIGDRYRHMRLFAGMVGFRCNSFPYQIICSSRKCVESGFWDDLNSGISMIVANSLHPLRMMSRLGLAAGSLNLLYILYVVGVYLFKGSVAEGWTTLSFQNSLMFFFIFVILTVLCEYTGRSLEESFNRPLYFTMEEKNSSVLISDVTRRNVMLQSE